MIEKYPFLGYNYQMFFYELNTKFEKNWGRYYLLLVLFFLPKLTLAQSFQVVNPVLSSVENVGNAQSVNFKVNAKISSIETPGDSQKFVVSGKISSPEENNKIYYEVPSVSKSGNTRGKYDASGWVLKRKYDQLVQEKIENDFLTSAPKLKNDDSDEILEWMKEFTINLEDNVFNESKKLEFSTEEDEVKDELLEIEPKLKNLETIELKKDLMVKDEIEFEKDRSNSILLALQKFWEEGEIPEYLNSQQKLVFAQTSQYAKEEVLNGNFEIDDSGIPIFLNENKKVIFEDFSKILRDNETFIIEESEKLRGSHLVFEKIEKNNSQNEENLYFESAPKLEERLDMNRFKLTDKEKKSLIIKKQFRIYKENPNELDIWKESASKLLNILILLTGFQFIAGGLIVRFLYKKNHRIKKFLKLYSPKK